MPKSKPVFTPSEWTIKDKPRIIIGPLCVFSRNSLD